MADPSKKKRLDLLLVERKLVESREKAKLEIMLGNVKVNGETIKKPSKLVRKDAVISLIENQKYVSRGALKLKGALEDFQITEELKGKIACDMGASTGGFTQILLEFGVRKVYAIDVGYGLLHWKLRKDPKVVVLERTNARYVCFETLGEMVDVITCDLSFISVCKVVPAMLSILKDDGRIITLIKPQFEAEKEKVRKGVVRDREVHIYVLEKIWDFMEDSGLKIVGLTFSKLRGPKGNIEFFMHLRKKGKSIPRFGITKVVDEAHSFFEGKTKYG